MEMTWIWAIAASFAGAVLSSLGMGGGGIMLIYLTVVIGMDQLSAQGVNLVFFVPVALVAIALHAKNRLIQWKIVLPSVILGLIGVYFGAKLATFIGSEVLSKLFGVFLLIIGVRELAAKDMEKNAEKTK